MGGERGGIYEGNNKGTKLAEAMLRGDAKARRSIQSAVHILVSAYILFLKQNQMFTVIY